MKLVSGHLTATEKQHIKAIIDANELEGRTKLKKYRLEKIGNQGYLIEIYSKYSKWSGENPEWHKNIASVTL